MSDAITHRYFKPGTYDVRLEVTDSLGNRYLAAEQIVTTGYGMALPILMGD
jgi:hypothetical protein